VTLSSDERGAELRELFFETAQELLQSLNEEALKLEKQPGDVETVRSIRRIVHTLKGDAAACGYRELSELAHELEDALALETISAESSLAEVAFEAADTFAAMLAAARRKAKAPSSEPLRKIIRELSESPSAAKSRKRKTSAETVTRVRWTEYEELSAEKAASQGKRVYHVAAVVDPHCAMPIAARQLMFNAISTLGEVLASRPEAGSTQAAKRLDFVLASNEPTEQITAKCRIPTVIIEVKVELMKRAQRARKTGSASAPEEHVQPVNSTASPESQVTVSPAEPEGSAHAAPDTAPAENILRVEAERIDNVLNLVGELIIGKSMLQQALNEFTRHFPKDSMRGRFADAMAFQARVLNDLQRSVMKIRMVPVEQLFRRFPRMVRDVAKMCGKDVDLVVSGAETDLDKSILDAIAEPLTHLVRNAVSHGIESAEERTRLGKPARGAVRLYAYHHGNQVIVEISDDGRGIDVARVKAKAQQQGLITAEEAGRLSEAAILELVFRPGFSTAEEITEISGRGVGLDVVQSVMHRLKGTVAIDTRPGQGTTFRLKLPLTLAIIKALLFRVDQRLYAMPLNAVAEITRARESSVHQVDNYEVLQMRNQVVPLVRLGRRAVDVQQSNRKLFVLVINSDQRKLGLIVDQLEGEEELVIKALDDQTVATDLVSGASILGDGRVVLILNLTAIVDRFARSRPTESGAVSSGMLLSTADRASSAMPEVQP
jgi:two-component system, chemotaxis family, sensor kinase CheA